MAGCTLLASGLTDEEAVKLSVAGPFGGVEPGHVAGSAGQVADRQVAPQVAPNRRPVRCGTRSGSYS